jgi:hypothetical protein
MGNLETRAKKLVVGGIGLVVLGIVGFVWCGVVGPIPMPGLTALAYVSPAIVGAILCGIGIAYWPR